VRLVPLFAKLVEPLSTFAVFAPPGREGGWQIRLCIKRGGCPLAARCGLICPEHRAYDAGSNTQYMHLDLNSTPVAPLGDERGTREMVMARTASGKCGSHIPSGEWQTIWDGTNITGPKMAKLSAPKGGYIILVWCRCESAIADVEEPYTLRMHQQDWSTPMAHDFPSSHASAAHRDIFDSEREVRNRQAGSEINGAGIGNRRPRWSAS
jgi:hypothetical protein